MLRDRAASTGRAVVPRAALLLQLRPAHSAPLLSHPAPQQRRRLIGELRRQLAAVKRLPWDDPQRYRDAGRCTSRASSSPTENAFLFGPVCLGFQRERVRTFASINLVSKLSLHVPYTLSRQGNFSDKQDMTRANVMCLS